MAKKKLQIIVPICIILAVFAIFVIKNIADESAAQEVLPSNVNFALESNAVDLESLMTYGLPIIIDFGSDSCIPCKEMAPVLKKMNEEMQGRAIIKFVDVWKYTDAADGFPVEVIPTQIFITADGKPYVPGEDVTIEFRKYSYNATGEHAFTAHQGGLTEEQMRAILADMV